MREDQIKLFIITERVKFPTNKVSEIKTLMVKMSRSQIILAQSAQYIDPNMNFALSFFCGFLGVDRFIINQKILGILKLITLGGLGIWMIIDWFFIIKLTKQYNFKLFMQFVKTTSEISPI